MIKYNKNYKARKIFFKILMLIFLIFIFLISIKYSYSQFNMFGAIANYPPPKGIEYLRWNIGPNGLEYAYAEPSAERELKDLGRMYGFLYSQADSIDPETIDSIDRTIEGAGSLLSTKMKGEELKNARKIILEKSIQTKSNDPNIQRISEFFQKNFEKIAGSNPEKWTLSYYDDFSIRIKDSKGETFMIIPDGCEILETSDNEFVFLDKRGSKVGLAARSEVQINGIKIKTEANSRISFSVEGEKRTIKLTGAGIIKIERGNLKTPRIKDATVVTDNGGNIISFKFTTLAGGLEGVWTYGLNEFRSASGAEISFDSEKRELKATKTNLYFLGNLLKSNDFTAKLDSYGGIESIHSSGETEFQYSFEYTVFQKNSQKSLDIFLKGQSIENSEVPAISFFRDLEKDETKVETKGRLKLTIKKPDVENEETFGGEAEGIPGSEVKTTSYTPVKDLIFESLSDDAYMKYHSNENNFDVKKGNGIIDNGRHVISIDNGNVKLGLKVSSAKSSTEEIIQSFKFHSYNEDKELVGEVTEGRYSGDNSKYSIKTYINGRETETKLVDLKEFDDNIVKSSQTQSGTQIVRDAALRNIERKIEELRSSGGSQDEISILELSRVELENIPLLEGKKFDEVIKKLEAFLDNPTTANLARLSIARTYNLMAYELAGSEGQVSSSYQEYSRRAIEYYGAIRKSLLRSEENQIRNANDLRIYGEAVLGLAKTYLGLGNIEEAKLEYTSLQHIGMIAQDNIPSGENIPKDLISEILSESFYGLGIISQKKDEQIKALWNFETAVSHNKDNERAVAQLQEFRRAILDGIEKKIDTEKSGIKKAADSKLSSYGRVGYSDASITQELQSVTKLAREFRSGTSGARILMDSGFFERYRTAETREERKRIMAEALGYESEGKATGKEDLVLSPNSQISGYLYGLETLRSNPDFALLLAGGDKEKAGRIMQEAIAGLSSENRDLLNKPGEISEKFRSASGDAYLYPQKIGSKVDSIVGGLFNVENAALMAIPLGWIGKIGRGVPALGKALKGLDTLKKISPVGGRVAIFLGEQAALFGGSYAAESYLENAGLPVFMAGMGLLSKQRAVTKIVENLGGRLERVAVTSEAGEIRLIPILEGISEEQAIKAGAKKIGENLFEKNGERFIAGLEGRISGRVGSMEILETRTVRELQDITSRGVANADRVIWGAESGERAAQEVLETAGDIGSHCRGSSCVVWDSPAVVRFENPKGEVVEEMMTMREFFYKHESNPHIRLMGADGKPVSVLRMSQRTLENPEITTFYIEGNIRTKVTADHLVELSDGSFTKAKDLVEGDIVRTPYGDRIVFKTETEKLKESLAVYSIETYQSQPYVLSQYGPSLKTPAEASSFSGLISQSSTKWNSQRVYARLMSKEEADLFDRTGLLTPVDRTKGELIPTFDANNPRVFRELAIKSQSELSEIHIKAGGDGNKKYLRLFRSDTPPEIDSIRLRRSSELRMYEAKFRYGTRVRKINPSDI